MSQYQLGRKTGINDNLEQQMPGENQLDEVGEEDGDMSDQTERSLIQS